MSSDESTSQPPQPISPLISLQLRIRWLEALILGVRPDPKRKETLSISGTDATTQTLMRKTEEIQSRFNDVLAENDALKRLVDHYDQYAQYLTPAFALSSNQQNGSESSMSTTELETLLSEMEPDIRAADRDLREIDALEKQGVTSAGKLVDYEPLDDRLKALVQAHEEDLATAASLERRIGSLLQRYSNKIDALSELFVSWNSTVSEAEARVLKLEREKESARKLGLD